MKKIISAKEQFENAVKNAKYVDEVCSYHYYYEENDEYAMFYACFEEDSDYLWFKFPKFEIMKMSYGYSLALSLVEKKVSPSELNEIAMATVYDLMDNNNWLTYYCDFLFCNGGKGLTDGGQYQDEEIEVDELKIIGAECTDINAISSMVDFLKSQLISRIEAAFCCLDEAVFVFNPSYGDNQYFYDVSIHANTEFRLMNVNGEILFAYDDDDLSQSKLFGLSIEELLCIYSQLHK